MTAVKPRPGPAAVSPIPGLQVPWGTGDSLLPTRLVWGSQKGLDPSLVTCFTKRTPPGAPSAWDCSLRCGCAFPAPLNIKQFSGVVAGPLGVVTCCHYPDGMAQHSPCALSGVGEATDTHTEHSAWVLKTESPTPNVSEKDQSLGG